MATTNGGKRGPRSAPRFRIPLQAGEFSSAGLLRPQISLAIIFESEWAGYCNSSRKKHCGAVLMLLVMAIMAPVPGMGLLTGVQLAAARLVVHSS